jgi:CheY-like chemotaxis protein
LLNRIREKPRPDGVTDIRGTTLANEGFPVRCRYTSWVLLAGLIGAVTFNRYTTIAQQVPPRQLPKSQAIYQQLRTFISEGQYPLAMPLLKDFLDSKPEPQDYIAIYDKYGPSAFTLLYRVPRWSDNPAEQKKAREYVETIVSQAEAALDQHIRHPQRIAKYIANLGATPEERVFAQAELVRIGVAAVPYMVQEIRNDKDKTIIEGIYNLIPHMDTESVAAWIAALDGLNPLQQYGVLAGLIRHEQFLNFQEEVQTSIIPTLWRLLLPGNETLPVLQKLAQDTLRSYLRGSNLILEKRSPERELLQIARRFYEGSPQYRLARKLPDASEPVVRLWRWSSAEGKLVSLQVPVSWANEYYGLRYSRWVAEREGTHATEAQVLMLSIMGKAAALRCQFGEIAQQNPAAMQLLVTAPAPLREEVFRQALSQKQTATLVAILQAAQVSADKELAATGLRPGGGQVSLLASALDYPDPLVQFLAADTLLRAPFPLPAPVRTKVVDILRRQLQDVHVPPAPAPGSALYLDPDPRRRDALLPLLMAAGFRVETFATGRDLLQRLRHGVADVIIIDRNAVHPPLRDLLSQLQADPRWSGIPTVVLASPDQLPSPTFEQLLLRTAALMAATDPQLPDIPAIYQPHPNDPPEARQRLTQENQKARDAALSEAARERRTRLLQIIDALPLLLSVEQRRLLELRVDIITHAVLAAQFPIFPSVSPQTYAYIQDLQKRHTLSPTQSLPDTRLAVEELLRILQRLELDVGRVAAARARFEQLYSQIDAENLGLPVARYRDLELEARLRQQLQYFPQVFLLPVPASATEIRDNWFMLWHNSTVVRTADADYKRSVRIRAVTALAQLAACPDSSRDVIPATPNLLLALGDDTLAPAALDALLYLPDPAIQPALMGVVRNAQRPLSLRQQAADIAIRHAQRFSPTLPPEQIEPIRQVAAMEKDALLRLRMFAYLNLVAPTPPTFRQELIHYTPPEPDRGKPAPPEPPKGPMPDKQ